MESNEEMEFGKYREIRIDYTESLGGARKSIGIKTYLTADEIMALVDKLKGVDA